MIFSENIKKTEENHWKTEETEESRNQTSWEHVGGDPHFLILQILQFFECFFDGFGLFGCSETYVVYNYQ